MLQGRGCVLIGTIEAGAAKKGDKTEIVGHGVQLPAVVNEIHVFKQTVGEAKAGDHVGILCKGVKAEQVCVCILEF
jgi:elongation factor Tu